MKLVGVFSLLLVLFVVHPAAAATDDEIAAESERFIAELANEAITALSANGLSTDDRREGFRAMLNEGFAVSGIARYAMGRYWRQASKDERKEFVQLFEDVVVAQWADRFTEYSGQKFEIIESAPAQSARTDEKVTLVRSLFFTSPDSPVRVDWRVATDGEIYKITDVRVGGFSMADTFRDEYVSVIRREGIDGFLSGLRAQQAAVN